MKKANYDSIISNWATYFLFTSIHTNEILNYLSIEKNGSCKSYDLDYPFKTYIECKK